MDGVKNKGGLVILGLLKKYPLTIARQRGIEAIEGFVVMEDVQPGVVSVRFNTDNFKVLVPALDKVFA